MQLSEHASQAAAFASLHGIKPSLPGKHEQRRATQRREYAMARLVALVIGNADYNEGSPLKNPGNDADDIARKLEDNGFVVTKLIDADFKEMRSELKRFAKAAQDQAVALLFFAGHGVQVDGVNYLIAIDTPLDDQTDVEHGALSLDEVIRRMEKADAATNIIILDACRDNPWDRKWRGKPQGLAPIYAPKGTLIAFATSPGQVASDGKGRNGAYTTALLTHIDAPDVPIEAMFKRVRNSLSAATNRKQISWEHTSLAGEFYFNLSAAARINAYSASAIKDKTFVLDESRLSHRTIRGLKTSNWYAQNAALDNLDVSKIGKAHNDNLFVLGRNILQAAHGSANSAIDWIRRFPEHTQELSSEKRKAILDGILFEIFFDSNGNLRDQPKANYFNEVFALQQYPKLKPSFDFISSALAPEANRMFVLPGKAITQSVHVKLGPDSEVLAIFVAGKNYLAQEEDEFAAAGNGSKTTYRKRSRQEFEEELSLTMLVPRHLLDIVYDRPANGVRQVKVPYGFKVHRPGEAPPT
jgi:hypothetical protein